MSEDGVTVHTLRRFLHGRVLGCSEGSRISGSNHLVVSELRQGLCLSGPQAPHLSDGDNATWLVARKYFQDK